MVSNMIYLIDGKRQPENYFWNCLHVLASEKEICRVLDGEEIVIGKSLVCSLFGWEDMHR